MAMLRLILMGALCAASVAAAARDITVTVVNPGAFDRASETIVLAWKDLLARNGALDARTVAVYDGRVEIPSQVIDTDADGDADELLFQSDFSAGESRTFMVRPAVRRTVVPSRADARFVLPREDLAWENDRIAFRIYGPALRADVKNGIDVWTKRVRSLIVQKWYKESEGSPPGKDSYHVDKGEGADFFSVGKTLGAGACAPWDNGVLAQPGVFATHRILAAGPLRLLFEVTYDSGVFRSKPFTAVMTVSLDAGHHLNRVTVRYAGIPSPDSLVIAAGLVKRSGTVTTAHKGEGWVSLWGPVNDDPVNESLGIAVVVPQERFVDAREDQVHVLALARAGRDADLTYYTGAAWTRSGDVAGQEDWNRQLTAWARRLRAPMTITLGTSGK